MSRHHDDPARKEIHKLGDELFRLVEENQGYFHVSDGETFPTKEQFFDRVRGRLAHGEQACKLMRGFLRKHGEPTR